MNGTDPTTDNLVKGAFEHDKFSIGRLITAFEDERKTSSVTRRRLMSQLRSYPASKNATFIGVTGTPGAGKSTLIGELAKKMITTNSTNSIAVLAVDPTSHLSGGSLLGDRTRVHFPIDEKRLFFRSQPSGLDLGGLGKATFQVCRLLRHLFDIVFIETVGIGQSEVDVRYLADKTYLVLQPLGGDQIQFMKAGIMEIPDVFIVNKCDATTEATLSYHSLIATLSFARPGSQEKNPDVFRTSAKTGQGIPSLVDDMSNISPDPDAFLTKELYFFEKWVRHEFGQYGMNQLQKTGGVDSFLKTHDDYDEAQTEFSNLLSA